MQGGRGVRDLDGQSAVRLVAALALLAACGGEKRTDPKAACTEAARVAVDAMLKQARSRLDEAGLPDAARAQVVDRTQRFEAMAPRQRAVLANRCIDDTWAAAVVRCYAAATSLDDTRACRSQLTAEQAAALQRDELELLVERPGPAGLSPPGAGAVRDPKLVQLLQERNELMKQLAAGSATNEAELKKRIDTISLEIRELEARAR